jgi:hypothetical protein
MRNIFKIVVGKAKRGKLGSNVYHNIKITPKETERKDVDWN